MLAVLRDVQGKVVTRDEVQQELWKGGTFVDFEHGLNAAMNRLRQTLGDSADHPRYIETLSGRGYRFIASIQDAATPDASTKPVLVMPPAPQQPETAPPVLRESLSPVVNRGSTHYDVRRSLPGCHPPGRNVTRSRAPVQHFAARWLRPRSRQQPPDIRLVARRQAPGLQRHGCEWRLPGVRSRPGRARLPAR